MNSLQSSAFNLAPPPTLQWQPVQIANFTAVAGRAYPCNTTSAAFTVTLPASPSAGDQITLTDYAGTFGTNPLTINPNGLKIRGGTENQTVGVNNNSVQLVYIDSTQGWLLYSAVTSSPFMLPTPSVDYLVVAGGGGGGSGHGGGGGAGGFRTGSGLSVSGGYEYTIKVGASGAGSADPSIGGNGGDSYIQRTAAPALTANPSSGNPYSNAFVAFGGGGGSGYTKGNGSNGGSGGGAAAPFSGGPSSGGSGNTPAATSGAPSPYNANQGSNGGNGGPATGNYGAGGGGGANTAGTAGDSVNGGAGGAGIPSSISGSSVTYAGGGGGGSLGGSGGAGGSGGGGSGTTGTTRNNGTSNTGGGGGGIGGPGPGGNGGSGIVIIRYPDSYRPAISTTGSPTITVSGGYRVYSWAGNGSITF